MPCEREKVYIMVSCQDGYYIISCRGKRIQFFRFYLFFQREGDTKMAGDMYYVFLKKISWNYD